MRFQRETKWRCQHSSSFRARLRALGMHYYWNMTRSDKNPLQIKKEAILSGRSLLFVSWEFAVAPQTPL